MAKKNRPFQASITGGRSRLPRAAGGGRLAPDLQVLLGIGGLLALVAVAIAVAVFLIVGLKDDTTHLADRHVEYAAAINAAALHAKGIANDERGFLISGRTEFLEQLEARTEKAREAFDTGAQVATGAPERQAVAEARSGFERWIRALHAEIAVFQAGDRQNAVTVSLGPTRSLRKSYEASLARAETLGASAIQSAKNSVSGASSRSVAILLAYLVVALAIGFGITLWIVRTILQPAYALLRLFADAQEHQTPA